MVVEVRRARENLLRSRSRPRKSRALTVPSGMPRVRRRRNILLVKIEEKDGVAVSGRKSKDGTAEGLIARGIVEGRGGDALVGRLGDFIERERSGGDAANLGAVEIGGEGEEPGGEGGIAAELGEIAPCADEGFLCHFFGAAAIAAEAPGEIDEGRLPASDDSFECGRVAGEDAGDQGRVFRLRFRRWAIRSHTMLSWRVRPGMIVRGFIFLSTDFPEKICNRGRRRLVVPGEADGRRLGRRERDPMDNENARMATALFGFLAVGAIALFSMIAVATWSDARRKEREA